MIIVIQQKTYKNWKELCIEMEWKPVGGDTKIKHLKELESLCKYYKEGNKFVIDEIYETQKEIIDKRKEKGSIYNTSGFIVPVAYKNSIGVYKIQLGNNIYIGSTVSSFWSRFLQHIGRSNKQITREMLDNGAIFDIIEICDDMSEPEIRLAEESWINIFSKDNKYNVMNKAEVFSYTIPKPKPPKYKNIKINENDFEKLIEYMTNNNIDYKMWGETNDTTKNI